MKKKIKLLSFILAIVLAFAMLSGCDEKDPKGNNNNSGKSEFEQVISVMDLLSGIQSELQSATAEFQFATTVEVNGESMSGMASNFTMYMTKEVCYYVGLMNFGEEMNFEMYLFFDDGKQFIKENDGDWEIINSMFEGIGTDFTEYNGMFQDFKESDFEIVGKIATLKESIFIDMITESSASMIDEIIKLFGEVDFDFEILSGSLKIDYTNISEPVFSIDYIAEITIEGMTVVTDVEMAYSFKDINNTTVNIPTEIQEMRDAA